jgi:hypothetical protein
MQSRWVQVAAKARKSDFVDLEHDHRLVAEADDLVPLLEQLGVVDRARLDLVGRSTPERRRAQETDDRVGVFAAKKCSLCHSIESLDVERTTKSEKIAGPDLSAVGKEHSAEWLEGWLRRQEKKDGKTHSREFKGTDAELEELVAWLAKLRG